MRVVIVVFSKRSGRKKKNRKHSTSPGEGFESSPLAKQGTGTRNASQIDLGAALYREGQLRSCLDLQDDE